ncbi:MAG: alpha/beta hydrolase [Chloroflexota bacterium]
MTNTTSLFDQVEHGYANNGDIKLHYVAMGDESNPLLVMIHGFPEFWYSWRNQIPVLAEQFRVVAVDLRGYNLSDQPKGVENYAMPVLASDIVAIIKHLGQEQAIIVGHDWGGMVSWRLAMFYPEMVERLIICNLPHPYGLARELATNPEQQKNSQYARNFQQEGYHTQMTAERLTQWITDDEARPHYLAAYQRSDFEAMLHYYKANYPREPYEVPQSTEYRVKCPVLMIHGLEDQALLPGALNDTWQWLEQDLTLVTVPGAGHFVQQDAPEMVNRSMLMWLNR